MTTFTMYKLVERILGQGETKSSVRLWGGIQADLRLVPAESRGAAMQYFTGSKSHNIALRDRAIARGFKLNEYGLVPRRRRDARGRTDRSGDLRGARPRGNPARAARRRAARSKPPNDARCRTSSRSRTFAATSTRTRPKPTAVKTSRRWRWQRAKRGCSTWPSPITARRSRWPTASTSIARSQHARRIREIGARLEGITLLAGIECDIRADGIDGSRRRLPRRARRRRRVGPLGVQSGRIADDRPHAAGRSPTRSSISSATRPAASCCGAIRTSSISAALIDAAAAAGVALEINCQVHRLDLSDTNAKAARDRGVKIVISTDSHAKGAFRLLKWGVQVARRAWLTKEDVLNTRAVEDFRAGLRRNRASKGSRK